MVARIENNGSTRRTRNQKRTRKGTDTSTRPRSAVLFETPDGLRYYTGRKPSETLEGAKVFTNGSEARKVAERLDGIIYYFSVP